MVKRAATLGFSIRWPDAEISHVARRTARPSPSLCAPLCRALCGDQPAGDTLVVTLLETALDQPELRARLKGGRIELYRALGDLWRSISSGQITALPKGAAEKAAQLRLSRITPLSRQALLLTTVEDFTTEQAAEIWALPRWRCARWWPALWPRSRVTPPPM
jgi:hypothetical protein